MTEEKHYMSHAQKVTLSKVVEKLPVNEHPNIYRIIKPNDPAALQDCEDDPNWTYVFFDILRPSTLKALEGYLASRKVNIQSEIRENNPALPNKEFTIEPTEWAEEKLCTSKDLKSGSDKTKNENIKARLRKTSRKSDV